jgi:hypothetical protein
VRDMQFPRDHKVAIIDPGSDAHDSINKFGDDVAYNRGWRNIRVFRDEKIAREWLGEVPTEEMRARENVVSILIRSRSQTLAHSPIKQGPA